MSIANFLVRFHALGASTFRLAVSLTLAFVATGLLGYAGYWVWTYPERQRGIKAEVVRFWAADLSNNLSMKLNAKTKLVDGTMYVALDFVGYPEYLAQPPNQDRGFIVRWDDVDGFALREKFLKVNEFTKRKDGNGGYLGLSAEFTQPASLSEYTKLAGLSVQWTVNTALPESVPKIDFVPSDAAIDHCAPGLNRQERLRRLARYGQVRQTGMGEFTAGGRSVNYLGSSNELYSCQ